LVRPGNGWAGHIGATGTEWAGGVRMQLEVGRPVAWADVEGEGAVCRTGLRGSGESYGPGWLVTRVRDGSG
jgi:hypothetical protein